METAISSPLSSFESKSEVKWLYDTREKEALNQDHMSEWRDMSTDRI
jgi:hypothetical protein